jgi:hypothetical protein
MGDFRAKRKRASNYQIILSKYLEIIKCSFFLQSKVVLTFIRANFNCVIFVPIRLILWQYTEGGTGQKHVSRHF